MSSEDKTTHPLSSPYLPFPFIIYMYMYIYVYVLVIIPTEGVYFCNLLQLYDE